MIFDGHTHFFTRFGPLRGMSGDEFVAELRGQGVDGAAVFTLEGFVNSDSRPYNDEVAELAAQRYSNVFLQFCGPPQIGMREMVAKVGWERCVFGSDFPFSGGRSVEQAVLQIGELALPEDAKDAILGGTFRRLVRL